MEHQRDDPSGCDWPQQYSTLPNSQECVQKFKDFRSGQGAFKSPAMREKTLAIKISMRDFLDFKKLLHRGGKEEKGFPRYSYDSSSSILTIQSMPTSLHEQVLFTISEGFVLARRSLPPSIRARISIVGNEEYTIFAGIYTGSERVPDLALQIINDMRVSEVKFVAEVGFSETYEELVQRTTIWLEGNKTVSLVMLVKLKEDPCYRCPIQNLTESEFAELEFPHMNEIRHQSFTLSGPYGPAVYKGFVWVGKISGFIEFWALDPVTRLASRITTRMNLLDMGDNTGSGLWLSKVLDIDDEHDCEVCFDWGCYLSNVDANILKLAVKRCHKTLKAREGPVSILDHDYQLPSPASSA